MTTAAADVKLYDLANARAILTEWLDESEGELTPAIEALLEQLEGQTTEKVERVALFIREQLATAAAIEEEIKRLGMRVSVKKRAAEGLKGYLKVQLERLGKTKVEGLLVSVAIQKNSQPSVTTALAPEELYALDAARPYVTRAEVVQYGIDRVALLMAWKADPTSVPPSFVVEQGFHIRIR